MDPQSNKARKICRISQPRNPSKFPPCRGSESGPRAQRQGPSLSLEPHLTAAWLPLSSPSTFPESCHAFEESLNLFFASSEFGDGSVGATEDGEV